MTDWYEKYLRTGLLPDGRRPVSVHLGEKAVFATFDPEVFIRHKEGKDVPWPGDGPAADGFDPNWVRV